MSGIFNTPTLAATNISPDTIGKQLGCAGYADMFLFGGQDHLPTLHNERRTEEDFVLLSELIGGLSDFPLLVMPTEQDRSSPLPSPTSHMHAIE